MLRTILGVICLLGGVLGLVMTYKNRYKITITAIFLKRDKYEVVNEKKFLRLQNIKSLLLAVSFICIGVLGICWSTKVYILAAIIPGVLNYIFSAIGKEYVRLKAKVYL